jgi:hypothetical protein
MTSYERIYVIQNFLEIVAGSLFNEPATQLPQTRLFNHLLQLTCLSSYHVAWALAGV